jgi:hypothetical protein
VGEKWRTHLNVFFSCIFLFIYLQGRIAQLQQEKEEILRGLDKKLAGEEDEQIMQPLHEMKV